MARTGRPTTPRSTARLRVRGEALFFGALVTVTDLLPPRIRYGYVHPMTSRLFARPLTGVRGAAPRAELRRPPAPTPQPGALQCALLVGPMDVGGIGSVVETLASTLREVGVVVSIVCSEGGRRAENLRAQGITVHVAGTEGEARRVLRESGAEVVELHAAPEHLEHAANALGLPAVPVLHNTEIHYSRKRWQRLHRVIERSGAAIAVSQSVKDFHVAHLGAGAAGSIDVVPNAGPAEPPPSLADRQGSRAALAEAVRAEIGDDDVVLVSLARYDSQKNIAGLVASFLATATHPRSRLVVAGDPSDWCEFRRADAIRRASAGSARVSLLGPSDARTVLAAADGFILDSFFEGWPMAATEAAAAGVPLVLSDVGGARELVDRDPRHSVLIANPCGPVSSVSDATVTRARRQCRRQPNARELGRAIDALASRARIADDRPAAEADDWLKAMADGHAGVLRRAARSAETREPAGSGAR